MNLNDTSCLREPHATVVDVKNVSSTGIQVGVTVILARKISIDRILVTSPFWFFDDLQKRDSAEGARRGRRGGT